MAKRRYQNPYIKRIKRSPLHFLGLFFGLYRKKSLLEPVPSDFTYPKPPNHIGAAPLVRWIGHCSFLVTLAGKRILTDPMFSDRASPFPFIGPKRRHPPAIDLNNMKSIDLVLISHNHYDHLDEKSVRLIKQHFPDVKWVVPTGLGRWFSRRGISNVLELDWWQETMLFQDMIITAVPAQHHSGRGLFDANKSLWAGFVVRAKHANEGLKSFYFVGDTAYNVYDFKKIGERFNNIDLCMCPIGTYEPESFMRTVHSSPKDAVAIHKDVRAKLSVGMHWKTFRLSTEGMDRPPYDLYLEMEKQGLNPMEFIPINPGEEISW